MSRSIQKIFFVLVLVATVLYCILSYRSLKVNLVEVKPYEGTFMLRNLLDEENILLNSNSEQVFFIETHMEGFRSLRNARQACSVESAARANPDMPIYFLMATNESKVEMEYTDLYKALSTYDNIKIRYINIIDYAKKTPLEEFFAKDELGKSEFRIEHTSDILRGLTLYKYGGLYTDLDVLSFVPLRILNESNFVCLERSNHFSSAIIRLDLKEGRRFSTTYVQRVLTHYDPKNWAGNGPDMYSPAFRSHCNGTDLEWGKGGYCGKLKAWPHPKCFPQGIGDWEKFYKEESATNVKEVIARNGAFFSHIWNKMLAFNRKTYKLSHDSKAAYVELAKVYCPKVLATRNYF